MKYPLNKEIWAGLFFIVGIIVIVFMILSLGSKTGITEPKYYVDVVFSDIGGLKVGAPVRVAGVDVGTVLAIDFISHPEFADKRVRVTLSVLKRHKEQVDQCSIFTIKTEGLLGDKLVDIQLPRKGEICELVKKEGYVIGQDPLDIKNLADDFSETSRYFIYLTKRMSGLVDDLQISMHTAKRVLDRIEERIIEGGLLNVLMRKDRK